MKHQLERYSPEINALRGIQGAVADLRHEAGQIPKEGDGWEGMNLDGLPDDFDGLLAAFDYAIGQAETTALMEVRWSVDEMYQEDGISVESLLGKAKSARAAVLQSYRQLEDAG